MILNVRLLQLIQNRDIIREKLRGIRVSLFVECMRCFLHHGWTGCQSLKRGISIEPRDVYDGPQISDFLAEVLAVGLDRSIYVRNWKIQFSRYSYSTEFVRNYNSATLLSIPEQGHTAQLSFL